MKQPMAEGIRFAVGKEDDLQSCVWRLWANRNDLYLAARSSAGLCKFSFHETGIWRFAAVSNEPRPPLIRWNRPDRSIEGITPVIDIIVPNLRVANAFRDKTPLPKKKLEWIDGPAEGTQKVVRIWLTDMDFTEVDILTAAGGVALSLHGKVHLAREVAWLMSYSNPQTTADTARYAGLAAPLRINLKPGSSLDGLGARLLIFEEGARSSRWMVDLPIGPNNVFVEGS